MAFVLRDRVALESIFIPVVIRLFVFEGVVGGACRLV